MCLLNPANNRNGKHIFYEPYRFSLHNYKWFSLFYSPVSGKGNKTINSAVWFVLRMLHEKQRKGQNEWDAIKVYKHCGRRPNFGIVLTVSFCPLGLAAGLCIHGQFLISQEKCRLGV